MVFTEIMKEETGKEQLEETVNKLRDDQIGKYGCGFESVSMEKLNQADSL